MSEPTPLQLLLVDDDWWDFTPQVALMLKRRGVSVDRLRVTTQRSPSCPVFRNDEAVEGTQFDARVRRLVEEKRYDWIIPCSDQAASLLRHAGTGVRELVFGGPAPHFAALLQDKGAMVEAVARLGVDVPSQVAVATAADVDLAIARVGLPAVVKGPGGSNGDQVTIVQTSTEAWAVASDYRRQGLRPVIQEYFAGEPIVVGGLFDNGVAVRLHVVRTVRRNPPDVGNSIEVETISDGAIQDAALKVFAEIRWTGLADIDLLRSEDGRYVFLELNGRPWGSMLVARQARVDLGTPLIRLLRGQSPSPDLSYHVGVRSRIFPKHLIAHVQVGTLAELVDLVTDYRTWKNAPLKSPRLTWHLGLRTFRIWAGTTRKRLMSEAHASPNRFHEVLMTGLRGLGGRTSRR